MLSTAILSGLLCASLIAFEHVALGHVLAHNALARYALGVATVLGCASGAVITDHMDWRPFAYVCGMFAVAGGVLAVFAVAEDAIARHTKVQGLRNEVDTATRD